MKKLDLHRTRHDEVRNKTIRFVEHHWGLGKEVEIITGNSSEMKALVMIVLDEYGLSYQIGRKFDLNRGYITVFLE